MSFLPLLPKAWGIGAVSRMSRGATLVGLQAPPPALNFEVKPYATAALRTDLQASPPVSNDPGKDVGFDVKYGLTKSLTLDATYNTDFAQVEADQTQVNLTRFSLFFPEKREFFLEGQGLFAFGGANTGNVRGNSSVGSNVVPVMFFSRQIGLNQGRAVPIIAGGRPTGRVDRYSVGALSITTDNDQTGNVPRTNFDVVRLKRDVFRQSSGRSSRNGQRASPDAARTICTASMGLSRSSTICISMPIRRRPRRRVGWGAISATARS